MMSQNLPGNNIYKLPLVFPLGKYKSIYCDILHICNVFEYYY